MKFLVDMPLSPKTVTFLKDMGHNAIDLNNYTPIICMIECKNIDEVRYNIDIIDREIVKLLS